MTSSPDGALPDDAMAASSPSLRYCRVGAAKGNTFYVDGAKGHDDASGSADMPWATVDHAIKTIKAGDTVVVEEGLYRIADNLAFGPAGTGHDALTTFRAAPGARVIFTSPAGDPPNEVVLHDYVRLEGLWFGGTRVPDKEQGCDITAIDVGSAFHLANLDGPYGRGKQLVGCTFFSYSEVSLGSNEDAVFASNRFIRTGRNCHAHPIYLSGGADSPDIIARGICSQHVIVDNNLFLSNEGFSMHGFHRPFSGIVTRNFVADSYRGFVWDGTDVLLANNFFWKQTGVTGVAPATSLSPGGALLYNGHSHAVVLNNLFGPSSQLEGDFVSSDTVKNNGFLGVAARGDAPLTLMSGQEAAALGISAADLDATVAAIRQAFTQPVEKIFADTTIEPALTKLSFAIPAASPLENAGAPWLGVGSMPIGSTASTPSCIEDLWDAFHAQGLRDVDRFAKLPDGSSP
jgi:hypothetical protein